MKYTVRVDDRSYEVEIRDIYARPVIARVDGHEFEVTLEGDAASISQNEVKEFEIKKIEQPRVSGNQRLDTAELTAPLPGTIIEVFIKAGDLIESGQVILIIEAMKMKNSIRSTRAGRIADVLVSAGQTVAHKQPLVRFG